MTILFLARLFYPHIGGVEKHVLELGTRLVAKGYKVKVITEELPGTGIDKNTTLKNGIEIQRIPVGPNKKLKKFRIWLWLLRNKNLIDKSDIIHCHDVFFWYLPFRFLYPRKPVYTTFHGYESYPVSRKAIIIRKISEKLSWGNICIGDFIKKWYGTSATFVSYGGVNVSTGKLEPRTKIKQTPIKQESAVFVGRLDEQTGVLTYVKAVELLKKKYPNFELLVVGDGEYKHLIDNRINVVGFKTNPEKYFKQHHFAFVSRYLSILEAMSAKRLIFAVYDNPIKKDYLKMTPFAKFIIIENNPERLAEKVTYYLNHPEEEKQLVDEAFYWVKKPSWEAMVELYKSLWKKSL